MAESALYWIALPLSILAYISTRGQDGHPFLYFGGVAGLSMVYWLVAKGASGDERDGTPVGHAVVYQVAAVVGMSINPSLSGMSAILYDLVPGAFLVIVLPWLIRTLVRCKTNAVSTTVPRSLAGSVAIGIGVWITCWLVLRETTFGMLRVPLVYVTMQGSLASLAPAILCGIVWYRVGNRILADRRQLQAVVAMVLSAVTPLAVKWLLPLDDAAAYSVVEAATGWFWVTLTISLLYMVAGSHFQVANGHRT